ncbi:MAG: magnesium and cobalt exporter, family [Candidatus Atribacteria bacterium]|nr:magnesium and cobalt exporter, family [Candidatus Atribacteria bacterium]
MEHIDTILLILLLIAINAFFAASEIAVISVRKSRLKLLKTEKATQVEAITRLLQNPSEFLATIQIGVTLAGFFASATGAISLSRSLGAWLEATGLPILGQLGEEIAVILVTVVISFLTLVLGELVPKRVAMSRPEKLSLRVAPALEFLSRVLRPMVVILSYSTDYLSRLLGVSQENIQAVTDEELKMFISEQKALPVEERKLINEVFDFGDTMAYEVMTPRTDMVCISEKATLEEALEVSMKSHFSRLPVFRDDLDHIIGFVHIKDVIPFLGNDHLEQKVTKVLRPIHFVPATKKVIELLREMQKRRVYMAIVLDEYGGTAGLVTIEDLLEELVGEIRDEHDKEVSPYRKLGENEFLVDASVPIAELNEALHLDIPESEEFESLGGLVMELLGKIPEEGEQVSIDGYQIVVERMKGKRIVTLRLIVAMKREKGEKDHAPTDFIP